MSSEIASQSTPAGTVTGFWDPRSAPELGAACRSTSAGLRSDSSTQGTRVIATTALVTTPMTAGVQRSRSISWPFRIGISITSYDTAARPVATAIVDHRDRDRARVEDLAEHQDDGPVPEVGAVGDLAEEDRGRRDSSRAARPRRRTGSAHRSPAPTRRWRADHAPKVPRRAGRCPRRGCRRDRCRPRRRRRPGREGEGSAPQQRRRAGRRRAAGRAGVGAVVGAGGVDLGPVELCGQRGGEENTDGDGEGGGERPRGRFATLISTSRSSGKKR